MEYHFGKNPEYTVHFFSDLTYWALPAVIYWSDFSDDVGGNVYISVRILCFYFGLEIWKWDED